MTKKKLTEHLIEAGYGEEYLNDKKKAELELLYEEVEAEGAYELADTVELHITSKRPDRYWMQDGSHVMFKDMPEFIKAGQFTPQAKAGDSISFLGGNIVAIIQRS